MRAGKLPRGITMHLGWDSGRQHAPLRRAPRRAEAARLALASLPALSFSAAPFRGSRRRQKRALGGTAHGRSPAPAAGRHPRCPGQRRRAGRSGRAGQAASRRVSHLSILITQRVMMEAVQHMTSMAMKTLQKRRPKIHSPPMRSVTLTKGMTARATERSARASETMR